MKRKLFISLILCILIVPFNELFSAQQLQPLERELLPLEQGMPRSGEISGNEVQTYSVALKKGWFLQIVVEQQKIDLEVKLISPNGQELTKIKGLNRTHEREPLIVETVAKASGNYILYIYASNKMAKPGDYRISIEELLPLEQHTANLAAKNDTLNAVKRWIINNAIPLRTVEAGNGFKDLQPLRKLIGTAHIVAMGEATHGTREFFQLKHRMLEFLVNEMGFTVFGIEASMPESFYINEYVLTGKGDPEKALASFYNWVWNTEEVLDMIKWMRSYNTDPLHTKKVKFYGFDMQSASLAVKVTLENLRKLDPIQADTLEKSLAVLSNPYTAPDFVLLPIEKKEKAATAIRTILKFFGEHRSDYINRGSASEWDIMRQQAIIVAQHIESKMNKSTFINLDPSVRDRSMADNIRWILNQEGPETKMVIWAHNLHVATNTTMGNNLHKMFGSDMFVFGFAFNQGSFQASEYPVGYIQYLLFPSEKGVHPFTVSSFQSKISTSLDGILAEAGLKYAVLNLQAMPKDGPVAKWFGEGQLTRNIGSVYIDIYGTGVSKQLLPQIYDALFFVEKSTASHLNESGQRPSAPILAAPVNLDFEDGVQGEPPVEWLVPKQSTIFGFLVTTSESNPHSGKRCAVISRSMDRQYGEMFGSLSQQIDATPYRGKIIKLNAAIRTDVSEQGNQAYLWLRITKKFFGPGALLFYDNMADRPITNNNWHDYEIVGKVPTDADVVGFGLALTGYGQAWLDSVSLEVIGE
jgi:erythromycin esterase